MRRRCSCYYAAQALLELTQQRTVPNVFVNGQHVGGNDGACSRSNPLACMLSAAERVGRPSPCHRPRRVRTIAAATQAAARSGELEKLLAN